MNEVANLTADQSGHQGLASSAGHEDLERPPVTDLQQRILRHDYDRLMLLTDGVFAIVITLAALELHPPEVLPPKAAQLWAMLLPSLLPYGITFLVISAYWSGHRRMMQRLHRVDGVASALALLFLGLVALQPAGLQLLMRPDQGSSALQLYIVLILATCLTQSAFWGYACFIADLVDPAVPRRAQYWRLISSLLLPALGAGIGLSVMNSSGVIPVLGALVAVAVIGLSRRLTDS